jgi:hypothetical protein
MKNGTSDISDERRPTGIRQMVGGQVPRCSSPVDSA